MKMLLILMGILAATSACTNSTKTTDLASKDSSVAETGSDTLAYTYKNFRKESKNISRNDKGTDTTYVFVSYPKFESDELNNFVKELLIVSDNPDAQANSVDEFADDFISNYDQLFISQKNYTFPWMKEVSLRVVNQFPGVISFAKKTNEFAGGAHGNYGTYYYNYSTGTNKNIGLDDLFTKENREKLDSIAEQIFRKNEKLSAMASLENGYFFSGGKFSLNENFLIQNNSLLFFYNPYEIKPYAAGTTELVIPYLEIKNIIKINAVITKLIKDGAGT